MKSETKVGLLFIGAIGLVAVFAFYLGAFNPFSDNYRLKLAYNFAGGIEVGSPVRVMGIKVGRVKSINFNSENKMANGEEVKLIIIIEISKKAWSTIREDSQFFINLAGVIGEKFIEVSPGASTRAELKPGQIVRGEDPPRIDQLISQSYGLAGKILEFVESNEGSVIDTINMLNGLVKNLNKLLKQVDKLGKRGDLNEMVTNANKLLKDMAYFSGELRSAKGEKTLELLNRLVWRLDDLDGKQIRKFLQEEGIKAKLF